MLTTISNNSISTAIGLTVHFQLAFVGVVFLAVKVVAAVVATTVLVVAVVIAAVVLTITKNSCKPEKR